MELNRSVGILKTILTNIERTLACSLSDLDNKTKESRLLSEKVLKDLRLQSYFLERTDSEELRKTHLLLLLNTHISCSFDLESDGNVGHVVGSIPRLSPTMYFAICYHFGLHNFLLEIIDMGPLMLCIEVLDIVSSELKHLSNYDCFKILILVLDFLATRMLKINCKYFLNKMYEQFQVLMLEYRRSSEQDPSYSKNRINDRDGFKFLSVICVLRVFTRLFYGPTWPTDALPLYDIKISDDRSSWYKESELLDKITILRKMYEKVFDKCRELMFSQDLDCFIAWHEIKFNNKTLQNTIVEEAYYLCSSLEEKLQNKPEIQLPLQLPAATSELLGMLKTIAKKPTIPETENEMPMTSECLEQKILTLEKFEEKLIKEIDNFLLENQFTPSSSLIFAQKLLCENSCRGIDGNLIKKVLENVMQVLSTSELQSLLNKFIEQHGLKHFLIEENLDLNCWIKQLATLHTKDEVESDEQDDEYKQVKEKVVLKQVLILGFQTPESTLRQLIKEGCSERNPTIVILKILETLKPLCVYQPESNNMPSVLIRVISNCLTNDISNFSRAEKEQFISLVSELAQSLLINKDVFLTHCLLPKLYIEDNSSLDYLADLITMFNLFFVNTNCKSTNLCLATILLQLVQILEDSRWTIFTFSMSRVFVCEKAIEAIQIVTHAFANSSVKISSTEWLVEQLNDFSTMTKSYLFKILGSYTETTSIKSKVIQLIQSPITESHEKFVEDFKAHENINLLLVGKIVLVSTQKELNQMVLNYRQDDHDRTCFILDVISNGISVIANAACQLSRTNPDHSESVFNCLGYMINNFLDMLQKNYVHCGTRNAHVKFTRYMNRIIRVLKLFPEQMIETYQFNIIKFIMEELPKMKEVSCDFEKDCQQLLPTLYLL